MRRHTIAALLLVASLVLAACGGDNKVGDEKILDFKEQTQQRLGETTTTAAPTETTAAPVAAPGGKAGLGATTVPPTTAAPATTAAPVTTTTTERKQAVFEIRINGDSAGAAQFDPSAARVFVGTQVRFTNADVEPRSVEADNGTFQSPSIAPGDSWTYNATTAGRFNYHDGTRPYAVASLEVLPR